MRYTGIRDVLSFQLAHARARDAVNYPLNTAELAREMGDALVVHSAARDRAEYLRRPDLGRRLDDESRTRLRELQAPSGVVFVVADGLSAIAIHRHAPELIRLVRTPQDSLIIAEQGRVAIGDEIGELLGAELAIVLIGERPGLSAPDSLGVYLTWAPRIGRHDAQRNCISNIRPDGLSVGGASELLRLLMAAARARRLSGVGLKIEATASLLP